MRLDHIQPVVNPEVGFESWDVFIKRLFVEADGYRSICKACHEKITAEQRLIRKNAKNARRKIDSIN